MHTDTQPTDGPFPPAAKHVEGSPIATIHAAQFPARLALARWQYGGDTPHLHPGVPALRAAFYEGVRLEFQAWLESGGFHGLDEAPAEKDALPVVVGVFCKLRTCT